MCIIGEGCGFGLVPEQMENLTFRIDTLNHRFCSYTESLKIFFSSSTPKYLLWLYPLKYTKEHHVVRGITGTFKAVVGFKS